MAKKKRPWKEPPREPNPLEYNRIMFPAPKPIVPKWEQKKEKKIDNLKTIKIVTTAGAVLATVICLGAGVGDRWVICAMTGSLALVLYVGRMIMED